MLRNCRNVELFNEAGQFGLKRMIEAAARKAHAHAFITEKLPDGYQTLVGLSGELRLRLFGGLLRGRLVGVEFKVPRDFLERRQFLQPLAVILTVQWVVLAHFPAGSQQRGFVTSAASPHAALAVLARNSASPT